MTRKILTCALLILVMSSCAYATLSVQFRKASYYYVGEEALATVATVGGLQTHLYTVIGSLPPGCYLSQNGATTANIKGKPTAAGTYYFSVRVQAKTLDYSTGKMRYVNDYGSVQCVMTVLASRSGQNTNTNGNNTNTNNKGTTGNNGNTNTNTRTNTNTGNNGVAGSSGGGCNSLPTLAIILAFALTLRKSNA